MKDSYEYKILNPVTGKYSRGGSHIGTLWNKSGKVWRGIGPLKNHLNICGRKILKEYANNDCIIVEYLVTKVDTPKKALVEDLVKEMYTL